MDPQEYVNAHERAWKAGFSWGVRIGGIVGVATLALIHLARLYYGL